MSCERVVFLRGETAKGAEIVLRPIQMEDAGRCTRWMNNPDLRSCITATFPLSFHAEEEWLKKAVEPGGNNPTDLVFAICARDEHIGNAGLHAISLVNHNARMGIAIGEREYHNCGIGRTVYELLLRYAFLELNLERVMADVYQENAPSRRLHESCGFKEVGRLPKWAFKEGKYQDIVHYYLAKGQWLKLHSS